MKYDFINQRFISLALHRKVSFFLTREPIKATFYKKLNTKTEDSLHKEREDFVERSHASIKKRKR